MVNIPKIVLKSQTRLTLNERFTRFGEQQEARLQMLKNDLHTRLVEESFQNGSQGSAELSEKLDRLARDIDNPERHQAFFSKKRRPKDSHRIHEDHDNAGEGEVSHWRAEALRSVKTADVSYRNAQKYANPLMRDSDDEAASGGGSSGVSVHSRLGLKHTARPKAHQRHKNRTGAGSHRRAAFAGSKGTNYFGGASASRQAVTKEDLDRELDEYRQKGSVMDIEMGDD